jgi:hypothetical protein
VFWQFVEVAWLFAVFEAIPAASAPCAMIGQAFTAGAGSAIRYGIIPPCGTPPFFLYVRWLCSRQSLKSEKHLEPTERLMR